jgi:hypothetical protein
MTAAGHAAAWELGVYDDAPGHLASVKRLVVAADPSAQPAATGRLRVVALCGDADDPETFPATLRDAALIAAAPALLAAAEALLQTLDASGAEGAPLGQATASVELLRRAVRLARDTACAVPPR